MRRHCTAGEPPVTLSIVGCSVAEIRAQVGRLGLRLPPEEWLDLAGRLGRDPTVTEGFLLDVALSEHCSYKRAAGSSGRICPRRLRT
jgi:phosphoribosylformylglycinamidine (FGAM) synthase-like enzyme